MQKTIGQFLLIVTVLVSIGAAFSWGPQLSATSGLDRAADESQADISQGLADIRCRAYGTASWECQRSLRVADESRVTADKHKGLQRRHVLLMFAVGSVAVTGAWWFAARRQDADEYHEDYDEEPEVA